MNLTSVSRRRAIQTLFCSSAAMALNLRPDSAAAEVGKEGLHMLMIGDFGTGGVDQVKVAGAMQKFVTANGIKPEGLLLLGDNFYGPVKDGFAVNSPRWQNDIENMYPRSVFPGPMWSVLGNHDYHDNPGGEKVQLAYAAQQGVRWKMPGKWYRFDLGPAASPLVTFICLDTNFSSIAGGVDKKTKKPRGSLSVAEEREQLAWLQSEVAKPRAPFTIVVGHHPLYSNGDHGDTKALIAQWEPLFQKHRVHAYLCGHDHDLQHLELAGRFTTHLLSGGGGARTRKLDGKHQVPFGQDVHGFTHLHIAAQALTFTHYSADGGALHTVTKLLDGSFRLA
ncbi:metallophosphoesterase [Prosthecobacter fluviatilis]|uniref:Metallophosphoesterase n=1 Tax=Prosthecobacter fluviatilis TaxID=445931 RepID=A0ABW0KTZ4_9BACT